MQMTHKLKALAAAVTLTFALGAQAAKINTDQFPNLGSGDGSGNLVLAMLDAASGKSAVFNTRLTVDNFNAQAAGSFNVSIAAADLNALNNFIGGVTDQTRFRWNLAAISNVITDLNGDAGGPFWDGFGFQTTAAVGTAITTATGPNSADQAIAGVLSSAEVFFSAQNSMTGNPLATGNVAVTNTQTVTSAFDFSWRTNLGGSINSFNNTGLLGQSLDYFFYSGLGSDVGQVQSNKYAGKWTLNFAPGAGTSLSYNVAPAPIPVPAAVWMLGSGIAGLIATRRRKAS